MADTASSPLKQHLHDELTKAMKGRDQLTAATMRMALTAITNEEVSGKEARSLSDEDVLTVLGREAKKRREAATAFDDAGHPDRAQRERDELAVLEQYLPQALGDAEVEAIVTAAVVQAAADGQSGPSAMGAVMKLVQPQVKGRYDGSKLAGLVKAALA